MIFENYLVFYSVLNETLKRTIRNMNTITTLFIFFIVSFIQVEAQEILFGIELSKMKNNVMKSYIDLENYGTRFTEKSETKLENLEKKKYQELDETLSRSNSFFEDPAKDTVHSRNKYCLDSRYEKALDAKKKAMSDISNCFNNINKKNFESFKNTINRLLTNGKELINIIDKMGMNCSPESRNDQSCPTLKIEIKNNNESSEKFKNMVEFQKNRGNGLIDSTLEYSKKCLLESKDLNDFKRFLLQLQTDFINCINKL